MPKWSGLTWISVLAESLVCVTTFPHTSFVNVSSSTNLNVPCLTGEKSSENSLVEFFFCSTAKKKPVNVCRGRSRFRRLLLFRSSQTAIKFEFRTQNQSIFNGNGLTGTSLYFHQNVNGPTCVCSTGFINTRIVWQADTKTSWWNCAPGARTFWNATTSIRIRKNQCRVKHNDAYN